MTSDERDQAWRILDIVLSITLTTSLAVVGWLIIEHQALDRRVNTIESNRFTVADGLELWKEIGSIKSEIATLPREVPPKWFVDRVEKLERKIDANAQRNEKLMETLNTIMQQIKNK